MEAMTGIRLGQLAVFLITWMTTVLDVDAAHPSSRCAEDIHLEVGTKGIISCNFIPFYTVSWYTKEDYDNDSSPLIYFNGDKVGLLDEYDIHPNGSLIIRTVSLNHAGIYIVTVLEDVNSHLIVIEIHVEVYVIPNPRYPVVGGRISQRHVYLDVDRDGKLSCSMKRVYPVISLSWEISDERQRSKMQFQHEKIETTQNDDHTFDVKLSSSYHVSDQSMQRITLICVATNEIGNNPYEKSKVDLLFRAVYPVVNGHVNQKRVFLDVAREGRLTCLKENVETGTTLVWDVVDPSMRDKISFQNNTVISHNNDDTVTINQILDYRVKDNLLERITIQCKFEEIKFDKLPLSTKVDLIFENVYPVVNGHINQKHVYLDVERKGDLTCVKKNVDAGTTLAWEVVDESMKGKITFESKTETKRNNEGTIDINETCSYKIHDMTLGRITVKCKVIESDTDEDLYVTRVELLLDDGDQVCHCNALVGISIVLGATVALMLFFILILAIYLIRDRKSQKQMKTTQAAAPTSRCSSNDNILNGTASPEQCTSLDSSDQGRPSQASISREGTPCEAHENVLLIGNQTANYRKEGDIHGQYEYGEEFPES